MPRKQSVAARVMTGLEITFFTGTLVTVASAFGVLLRALTLLP